MPLADRPGGLSDVTKPFLQDMSGQLSLWRRVNPPLPPVARLLGNHEAEVVVVGAGMAGLSSALHLAQMGRQVVVLDAVQAHADGASASAGVIAPQLVRNTPASVLRRLGREQGDGLLQMIAQAGRHAFDLIAEHDIDCAAVSNGFLAPVTSAGAARQGQALIEAWRPYRQDLRWLDAAETADMSGCRGYAGSLLDESGGGIDPVALLQGLERALVRAGGVIHRDSKVISVVKCGAGWQVLTRAGAVLAPSVLLCANGGNGALHPALAGSVLPLPVCELATAPLPEAMRRAILPHGHTLTDTATDVFSLRFDRDGRLVTAQGGAQGNLDEVKRRVTTRLEQMLPAYRAMPFDCVWQGTAWINGDLLPRAVRLDEGLTAVQACNGRGLAVNLIAGREMARWLDAPSYRPLLPIGRPRRMPAFALMRHVPRLLMAGSALARRMTQHFTKGEG